VAIRIPIDSEFMVACLPALKRQTDSYQGMPSGLPLNALLLTRLRALDFES
jgi:hypothetical protein